jgi:hypothetical protein
MKISFTTTISYIRYRENNWINNIFNWLIKSNHKYERTNSCYVLPCLLAVVQVEYLEVNYNHRLRCVDRCHLLKGYYKNLKFFLCYVILNSCKLVWINNNKYIIIKIIKGNASNLYLDWK